MIKVKIITDFEEYDGYSLARESEIGLPDETVAEIAKAIAERQKKPTDIEHPAERIERLYD